MSKAREGRDKDHSCLNLAHYRLSLTPELQYEAKRKKIEMMMEAAIKAKISKITRLLQSSELLNSPQATESRKKSKHK
jgi:hypothetical protein